MPDVDWSLWPVMLLAWTLTAPPVLWVQYYFWKKDRAEVRGEPEEESRAQR